nr:MAG TPA: hypothetical protein [Microviridae sp.]
MSFRFSKIPRSYGRSCPTVHVKDVVQRLFADSAGVQRVSFVSVDNADVCAKIPSPSDYSLENLLRAGVPLKPENPSILDGEVPSDEQISKFVDSLPDSKESDKPLND